MQSQKPEFDLFEAEESIILKISSALERNLEAPEAKFLLEGLLREYEKLLRSSRQLIKISDRKAKELNLAKHRLQKLSEALEYQATHDALTGVLNKGAITEIAKEHLSSGDFVVVLFDIDHFKSVNDRFGHAAGDAVLSLLANLVERNIKRKDHIGRFGGEEFMILLNDTPLKSCFEIMQNLRGTIEHTAFPAGETEIRVTVSMGLCACRIGEDFKEVYERVDRLLYDAKRKGRNRIESFPEMDYPV